MKKKIKTYPCRMVASVVLILAHNGCKTYNPKSKDLGDKENYEIEYHTTSGHSTKLVINSYGYEEKSRLQASVIINDIIFSPKIENDSILPIVIELTEGFFNARILLIGKKPVNLKNIKAGQKDSIVISAYLKNHSFVME